MGLKLERSTTVNSAPQAAWDVFADVSQWPAWSEVITEAAWISGEPWQKGSRLKVGYKLIPLKTESEVKEASSPNKIQLTGGAMGITSLATFNFTSQPDGSTLIQAIQELEGGALEMFEDSIKPPLEKTLEIWVARLKQKIEAR